MAGFQNEFFSPKDFTQSHKKYPNRNPFFPPQSLITGDEMFMPEDTIFSESKLSVGLMAGFKNFEI
jgi:hypothetical protein